MNDLSILVGFIVNEKYCIESGTFGFDLTYDGNLSELNVDVYPIIGFMVYSLCDNIEKPILLNDEFAEYKLQNTLMTNSIKKADLLNWSHAGLGIGVKFKSGEGYSIESLKTAYRLYNKEYKLINFSDSKNEMHFIIRTDLHLFNAVYSYNLKDIDLHFDCISTKTFKISNYYSIAFDIIDCDRDILDYLGVADIGDYYSLNNVYMNKRNSSSSLILPNDCKYFSFNNLLNKSVTEIVIPKTCSIISMWLLDELKDRRELKIYYGNPDIEVYLGYVALSITNFSDIKKNYNIEFVEY